MSGCRVREASIGVGCISLVLVASGCASSTPALSLDDVVVERIDANVTVALRSSRLSVNYVGSVGEAYERIQWSVEGCIAQCGVIDPETAVAGPVEADWRYHDTVVRLASCLRALGVSIPTLPPRDQFGATVAAGDPWNPVALAMPAAQHERVSAACPNAPSELERRMLVTESER